MCYSIPGKIIDINQKVVTVEYFGEKRRAKNDFFSLVPGDYVYAQGGLVVQKLSAQEALPILDAWGELFFKLQEIDLRLAQNPKNLYQAANNIRQKHHGNSCCTHGIIEFSNYCGNDCQYCGIRKSNIQLQRYRMDIEEIIQACEYSAKELNFKALVLQSGEDFWYDKAKLAKIVEGVIKKSPLLLILSIGDRDIETYRQLYDLGARGILMRFETSNQELYEKYKPGYKLGDRLELIRALKEIGYLVFTGFLIGLPGQTEQDLLNDIELIGSLNPDMFSFGPFIPHPNTPLKDALRPSPDSVFKIIARTRIKYPDSRILVTTALQTLDKENGSRLGFLSGANSMMINLTPDKYLQLYEIYPLRAGTDQKVTQRIEQTIKFLHSIGRAPTDLGL